MYVMQKINNVVSVITRYAMIVCFVYMTVVLAVQIFGRYLFRAGFSWTEESARYIMIWAVFLGAAYIALNAEHIKVSIIEDMIKKEKNKQILVMIQHMVGMLFCVIILIDGFMQLSIARLSTSANTGLSMLFPYTAFPVTFAFLSYAYFYRIVDSILKLRRNETGGGDGN